jgi:hypothetical protein
MGVLQEREGKVLIREFIFARNSLNYLCISALIEKSADFKFSGIMPSIKERTRKNLFA